MSMQRRFSLLYVGLITFGLVGCGGGGGGETLPSTSLSFPSNSVLAEPTIDNGKKVKNSVDTDPSSGLFAMNSVNKKDGLNVALLSTNITKNISNKKIKIYSLNDASPETYECSDSGTYTQDINGDNSKVYATISYNNCVEDGVTMDGTISATLLNYDSINETFQKGSFKFSTDFNEVVGSETVKIAKNSYINYELLDNTIKLLLTIIAEDNTQKYGIKDSEYYYTEESNGDISMYQTKGDLYINNLDSYVTFDKDYNMSATPFIYSNERLISGEARYNMARGKVKIIVENGTPKTYIDQDGDGTFELSE